VLPKETRANLGSGTLLEVAKLLMPVPRTESSAVATRSKLRRRVTRLERVDRIIRETMRATARKWEVSNGTAGN
jgi:hypothetical protein